MTWHKEQNHDKKKMLSKYKEYCLDKENMTKVIKYKNYDCN